MRAKTYDVVLLFLTFLAIVTYEYACEPANITPNEWIEWVENEVWKLVVAEIITIMSYLIIFCYCFAFRLCDALLKLPPFYLESKRYRSSYTFYVIGLINVIICVEYAIGSELMDAVPNNHLHYNVAGLRFLLPALLFLTCFIYIALRTQTIKYVVVFSFLFITVFYFKSDQPPLESVKYNSSKEYCHVHMCLKHLRVHQVVVKMLESHPTLFTCKNTYDVSWMDKIPGKPNIVAYPNVTLWGMHGRYSASVSNVIRSVRENLINLNGDPSQIQNHELVISRMESIPKVFIKTVRRADIALENGKTGKENLFIIFLDSLARPFAERYLIKTIRLLQSWKRELKLNYHTYMRFHDFPGRTKSNRSPFFTGYSPEYLNDQETFSKPTFPELFKKAGYVTGYVSSSCEMGFWGPSNIESTWLASVPRSYFVDVHHHQMLFCDKNFINEKIPLTYDFGPWASGKHCMYGKQTSELAGDYAISFFQMYYDKPKFMNIDLQDLHDNLGANLQSIDDSIHNILKDLEDFTVNTTFVIHGDHPHLLPFDNNYHIPFLIIIRPAHHHIPPQAELNQQKLYTVYDFRRTLLDIFSFADYREQEFPGRNLYFDTMNSRNCREANIPIQSCKCS